MRGIERRLITPGTKAHAQASRRALPLAFRWQPPSRPCAVRGSLDQFTPTTGRFGYSSRPPIFGRLEFTITFRPVFPRRVTLVLNKGLKFLQRYREPPDPEAGSFTSCTGDSSSKASWG